jgi:uncharacterized membrane-anchored protein
MWRESPNVEKDITIVKDENKDYWMIVSVTNIADGVDKPIIEEIKVINKEVVKIIVKRAKKEGTSDEVIKEADEFESITSGVIHDGEAYEINHNVKPEKLSSEIKKYIKLITQKEGVDVLSGRLYNIEQHSDAVVSEFSFNYIEEDGNYTRYFIIK